MDFVRLLVTGVLSFLVLLACAMVAVKILPANTPPLLFGLALAAVLVVFALVMSVVFNLSRRSPARGSTVADLDAQGLVDAMDYRARRAFKLEELEDEGPHYFVELSDATVLYLNGRYLDDYDIEAAASQDRPAMGFPNSEFTVLRHRTGGSVLDLICKGSPMKPEATALSSEKGAFRAWGEFTDGSLIRDRSYDSLKAEFVPAART